MVEAPRFDVELAIVVEGLLENLPDRLPLKRHHHLHQGKSQLSQIRIANDPDQFTLNSKTKMCPSHSAGGIAAVASPMAFH